MRTNLVRGVALNADTFVRLRHEVRAVAEDLGFSHERCMDLLTAIGEAAMNALLYCGGGTVRVHTDDSRTIQVWVEDAGPMVASSSRIHASAEKIDSLYHGHGFRIMARLMDRIWILAEQDGTTIVMEQDCDALEEASFAIESPNLVY